MTRSGVVSVIAMGLLAGCNAPAPPQTDQAQAPSQPQATELSKGMRKLWEDHITWTRGYIVAAAAKLPEKEATATRLLQNQVDIGDAVKPFYGEDAGNQLTALLKGHIVIATEIIDAAMRGDAAKKDAAAGRWDLNADSIATLLNGANPTNWPLDDLKQMLHSHLSLTTEEVTAHLQKNWAGSVAAYDKVHDEILKMADALTAGIAKQFPDKAK